MCETNLTFNEQIEKQWLSIFPGIISESLIFRVYDATQQGKRGKLLVSQRMEVSDYYFQTTCDTHVMIFPNWRNLTTFVYPDYVFNQISGRFAFRTYDGFIYELSFKDI